MKKIYFLIIILFSFIVETDSVFAADLGFRSASNRYNAGDRISLDLMVENNTEAINAISGSISFSNNVLSISSVSKANSIVSYWASEPSYSNTEGNLHFEGIIPNPGFSGGRTKILTINLVAKTSGTAQILFTSGSVLANDGLATEVVGTLNQITLTVAEAKTPTVPAPVVKIVEVPVVATTEFPTPEITSSTHTDQALWYNNASPVFNWTIPKGVTGIKLGYDNKANGIPAKAYTPAIATKTINNLDDGVYFFHAQFQKGKKWGDVATYGFQIDTIAPASFTPTLTGTEQEPALTWGTTDYGSGLDRYEVSVDGDLAVAVPVVDGQATYVLPKKSAGPHVVIVSAFDRAGNKTAASLPVNYAAPVVPEKPVVTHWWTNNTFLILYELIALLILVTLILIWVAVIRFRLFKNKVNRELEHVIETLKDDFVTLRDHFETHRTTITPGATKEKTATKKLLKNSKDHLDLVERDITHKIEHLQEKL